MAGQGLIVGIQKKLVNAQRCDKNIGKARNGRGQKPIIWEMSVKGFVVTLCGFTFMIWTPEKDKLMRNHRGNSVDRFAERGFRAGMARDKLVFVIICSAALLMAMVTLVHFFMSTYKTVLPTHTWQCVGCDYEFTKRTAEFPPIKCPKCDRDAVWVVYENCPECGKKNLLYRKRLSEQGKAQRDAAQKQAEQAGEKPPPTPVMADMEIQFWVKQADGSYAWTNWINTMAGLEYCRQLLNHMRCSQCGALLLPVPRRSGRSEN